MNVKCFCIAIIAMLCSFVGMRAERIMPTKPNPVTPESGKTYYLYNVGTERLLGSYASNTSYAGLNVLGREVLFTQLDNGAYTFRFTDNNYYFTLSGSTRCRVNSYNNIYSYCYWQISSTDEGYYITASSANGGYSDVKDKFVGAASATSEVVPNLTEGNIVWQFYSDREAINLYTAKMHLYEVLEEVETAGYNIEREEAIYNNPASTAQEIEAVATSLSNGLKMSNGFTAPDCNEYPILFQASEGTYGEDYQYTWALPNNNYTTGTYFRRTLSSGTSTLTATVKVDALSTLLYDLDGTNGNCNLTVYVDGVQKRYFYNKSLEATSKNSAGSYNRFFEVFEPGTHTISWEFTSTTSSNHKYVYVRNIACMRTDKEISVNLLEPGSLGTEVLYGGVNHIKDVRKLKVKGPMNNDDWAQIQLMGSLFEIDLSEAEVTSIPNGQFQSNLAFLHKVSLPKTLQSIGDYSLAINHIEELYFPEGCQLKTIGAHSMGCNNLREVILPDSVQSIGEYAMDDNFHLKKVSLGKALTTIPKYCFQDDYYIEEMILPNTITVVDEYAFQNCYAMKCFCNDDDIIENMMPNAITTIKKYGFNECRAMQLDSLSANLQTIAEYGLYGCNTIKIKKWPETLTTIGQYAFAYCWEIDTLVIPNHITSLGQNAFQYCTGIKYAELPSRFYTIANSLFVGCNLETLTLNTASVAEYNSTYPPVDNNKRGSITLRVPNYLVNYYKQDSYWYNFKEIEGFSTDNVDLWDIYRPCVLDAHNRYLGTPDVNVYENASLKITGALPMDINNFMIDHGQPNSGQFQSNCENIAIKGDCKLRYWTEANRWYFISLPFDMAVADLEVPSNMQYAIRYYDGANRAANGASGSWKNYTSEDIIPAGTGFIYQTSVAGWTHFHSLDNETKQNMVAYEEFVKLLSAHESENAADKGWNLVGNPYQTYYNNHYLNFTAPITVRNVSNNTYVAKSLIDDDYAIQPNEAFFVQCPNEVSSLSFPIGGRQLTSVITDQNVQAKARTAALTNRQIIDLSLTADGYTDKTRVVLNEEALCSYELSCDASKFFSDDSRVPQLFTVGTDGVEYAINERPVDNGEVSLAFYAPTSGTYTLSLTRCNAEHVYLTDHTTGVTTDLLNTEYEFDSEAGSHTARLSLSVVPGATDIAAISERQTKVDATDAGIRISGLTGTVQIYSADGRLVAAQTLAGETETIRMPQGIYIVRAANHAYKVVIK
ncbi:MAG: leucine-rich repeat domain-containing protein [Bacteroides sp.]|nr:leucine-rich repeat domain-containing protein [Roseburia sp.]MCM1346118.1 leucine-rich repeat domain-containing protein [Bacteroides sp.]MCM1421187.1 leucine-rich repeat domain-containing protein [Bacteroides sp.]